MSILGIDVGTTGCKAALFSDVGTILALKYREYDVQRPRPRMSELDASVVWDRICDVIRETVANCNPKDIRGISATSMGENVVPVSKDRRILGPSILNVDYRGEEYLSRLSSKMNNRSLHELNGNVWGNQYSLPKLMWIKQYQSDLYDKTYKFLHWASFVMFMLGSDPYIDYSLANRSLLFDINTCSWSETLLNISGLDKEKLPITVPSGTLIGELGVKQAQMLGLCPGIPLISGAHDQCANALGCGVVEEKMAMYGMGTFPTIAPVYAKMPDRNVMLRNNLNIEHHAVPDRYISFLFHMGGATIKWYRDTLGTAPLNMANGEKENVYTHLYGEMPQEPAPLLVLPQFAPMGPPDFEDSPFGSILGMNLETTRGAILKAIVEANTFALNILVEQLPSAGIEIEEFRAAGGGSRNDLALQVSVDILGKPFIRSHVPETGALGAAMLAGIGSGLYRNTKEASEAVGSQGDYFEPNLANHERYKEAFEMYKEIRTLLKPISLRWQEFRNRLDS